MGATLSPLRLAALALLLVAAACGPAPAHTPTPGAPAATTSASGQTLAPSPSPVRYPTLPPEWTATAIPTFTLTPLPPTPTKTHTPVPTLAFTVTAAVAGATFTGTTGVHNQPLALPDALYRVDWEYIGPADTAFTVRLASPDSNTTLTFVDGLGPQRGASDLRIIGTADLLLSVEAAGPWVIIIRRAAEIFQPTATPTLTPPSTPLTPSPAPT